MIAPQEFTSPFPLAARMLFPWNGMVNTDFHWFVQKELIFMSMQSSTTCGGDSGRHQSQVWWI